MHVRNNGHGSTETVRVVKRYCYCLIITCITLRTKQRFIKKNKKSATLWMVVWTSMNNANLTHQMKCFTWAWDSFHMPMWERVYWQHVNRGSKKEASRGHVKNGHIRFQNGQISYFPIRLLPIGAKGGISIFDCCMLFVYLPVIYLCITNRSTCITFLYCFSLFGGLSWPEYFSLIKSLIDIFCKLFYLTYFIITKLSPHGSIFSKSANVLFLVFLYLATISQWHAHVFLIIMMIHVLIEVRLCQYFVVYLI